jgi:NTP pyrophosphatase (non-canonical NTP hydrolase)
MAKLIFTDLHEMVMLHYLMLTRQITSLADCLLHIIRLYTRAKDRAEYQILFNGYRGYAQTELADVICQVKRICEILGLSFEETCKMGDRRYSEKMEEFKKRYPEDEWI